MQLNCFDNNIGKMEPNEEPNSSSSSEVEVDTETKAKPKNKSNRKECVKPRQSQILEGIWLSGPRGKVIKEIVDTEKAYLRDLYVFLRVYYRPLEIACAKGSPIIAPKYVGFIFNNIKHIYQFNYEFFKALQDRIEDWEEKPTVSDVFINFAPYLKSYMSYINNLTDIQEIVKTFSSSSKVSAFLAKCSKDHDVGGQDMDSYLIKPVQRVTRYPLLIRDLIKHTKKDSPDYAALQETFQEISKVAEKLNEARAQSQKRHEMLRVQKLLSSTGIDLLEPGRTLHESGPLGLVRGGKLRSVTVYMFNDGLLITEVRRKKPRIVAFLFLNRLQGLTFLPGKDFKFKMSFSNAECVFHAKDDKERQEWVARFTQHMSAFSQKKNHDTTMKRKFGLVNKKRPYSSRVRAKTVVIDECSSSSSTSSAKQRAKSMDGARLRSIISQASIEKPEREPDPRPSLRRTVSNVSTSSLISEVEGEPAEVTTDRIRRHNSITNGISKRVLRDSPLRPTKKAPRIPRNRPDQVLERTPSFQRRTRGLSESRRRFAAMLESKARGGEPLALRPIVKQHSPRTRSKSISTTKQSKQPPSEA